MHDKVSAFLAQMRAALGNFIPGKSSVLSHQEQHSILQLISDADTLEAQLKAERPSEHEKPTGTDARLETKEVKSEEPEVRAEPEVRPSYPRRAPKENA